MKSQTLIKLAGVLFLALFCALPVHADKYNRKSSDKKPIVMKIDEPIIDYLAKIYGEELNLDNIYRVQKFLGQIDNITISFKDQDAAEYVLVFKDLDEPGLEQWMFDEGYLTDSSETQPIEPWMTDPNYLQ